MPPGLRRRGGGSGLASAQPAHVALPEYQPPSCPLEPSAREALGELSGNRGIAPYEAQLKEFVRYLGHSVGDLNERLLLRKGRLGQLHEVRRRKGTNKTSEEERLEGHVPQLEKDVKKLTAESEAALRQIIDQRAELEDEAAVLGNMVTSVPVAAKPAVRASQREDSEDGPETKEEDAEQAAAAAAAPAPSLVDMFRKLRAEKRAEYRAMEPYRRYALDNDYKGFKKLWHDAAVGENGPPLPDATRWFTADGEPDMSTSSRVRKRRASTEAGGDENDEEAGPRGMEGEEEEDDEQEGGGQEDEDAEISIQRVKLSINCPLTLLPMKEPFRNNKCPHVFEKSAILGYLKGTTELQCPQTGCSQVFSRPNFERDFSLDEAMLRRIVRERKAQESLRDLDDIDEDEDEDDRSMVVGPERQTGIRSQRVKPEHS